jgi:hypothetical protein
VRAPAETVVGLAEKLTVGALWRSTFTARCIEPPGPVQASVKVVAAVMGPTLWLPLGTDFEPGQPATPPLAVQPVALLVLQLSVLEPPLATDAGVAERLTVGAGFELATETVTERFPVPPWLFAQVSENVVDEPNGPRLSLPLVGFVPLQPSPAVQLVAPLLDQVSVVMPCAGIDVGLALRLTVGTCVPLPGLWRYR